MLRTPASLSAAPTSTWAGLPAAASAQGQIFRVTDYGIAGVGLLVISDGTRWVLLGPQMLARGAVAASVTGTTVETVLATATVPGGLLGPNGSISVIPLFSTPNTANNKTLKIKLGSAALANVVVTTVQSVQLLGILRNRGAANSQVSTGSGVSGTIGGSAAIVQTFAVDTTVDQQITLTGTLATAAELMSLESFSIEVMP